MNKYIKGQRYRDTKQIINIQEVTGKTRMYWENNDCKKKSIIIL